MKRLSAVALNLSLFLEWFEAAAYYIMRLPDLSLFLGAALLKLLNQSWLPPAKASAIYAMIIKGVVAGDSTHDTHILLESKVLTFNDANLS